MSLLSGGILLFSLRPSVTGEWKNCMNYRQLALLVIALANLLLYMELAKAESWQQGYSVRISTEHDTNPYLTPAYQGDGLWRAMVDPSYSLTGTFGIDELRTGAALHSERSSNKTLSQNRDDPSVFLNWRRQGETSEWGIAARYDEAATRSTELDSIGVVTTDGTRTSRTVSPNWKKSLSERSTLDASAAYSKITYKGGAFIDYVTQTGGIIYSYDWSESSTPFLKWSYNDYTPTDNGPASHLYSTMLGLNWKASDQLEGTIQAGRSRSDSAGSSDSSQGGVVLRYTEQRARFAFNAARQAAASGLGGFVITDQANANWTYEMSEHNTAGVDLGWQRSHLITDTLYRTASVWLQHDLSFYWATRLYYQHRNTDGGGINNAFSNILGLSFTYTHPDF